MVLIRINRKLVKASFAMVLVLSFSFNIYSHINNVRLIDKYDSLVYITNQIEEYSLVAFVTSAQAAETANRDVEIFDISKGDVIKRLQPNASIQKTASSYLNQISGIYIKVKAFPDKGYIVRIPFKPPVKVQTHWLTDYNINSVDEVFILFPQQGNPYLMVLDNKSRPAFYTFEGDISELLKELDFYPAPT